MNNNDEMLLTTKTLTEANAKAIHELAIAVKELANTVREEDKELKSAVTELLRSQTECKFRYKSIENRLSDKKQILAEVKKTMDLKADIKDLDSVKSFIHKVLWWLFGGMSAILAFLIKTTLFKGA